MIQLSIHPLQVLIFESLTDKIDKMEDLKYCLFLATVIGYVVATKTNPTLPFENFPGFKVEGNVAVAENGTILKIQDYKFPGKKGTQ